MSLQQSQLYGQHIQALKWNVLMVDGIHIFIKRFPIFGGLAKIQRSSRLPDVRKLLPIIKEFHLRSLAVEPEYTVKQTMFRRWCRSVSRYVRLNRTPFLPTKTILINLTPSEKAMFKRFSEAKRRAVRRALKHHVLINESSDIHALINIKNKSAGLFGFITTQGLRELWRIFAPKHAAILLAQRDGRTVGGVLLLFHNRVAYYWIAAATKEGKKLFAPTLLVWEALKLAKSRGAKQFDFVGVWDERLPNKFADWKGFTKFKEGFSGIPRYYPTR